MVVPDANIPTKIECLPTLGPHAGIFPPPVIKKEPEVKLMTEKEYLARDSDAPPIHVHSRACTYRVEYQYVDTGEQLEWTSQKLPSKATKASTLEELTSDFKEYTGKNSYNLGRKSCQHAAQFVHKKLGIKDPTENIIAHGLRASGVVIDEAVNWYSGIQPLLSEGNGFQRASYADSIETNMDLPLFDVSQRGYADFPYLTHQFGTASPRTTSI